MATYGRNRQSIADIEETLQDIFRRHPESHLNDQGEPQIPADYLEDVLNAFAAAYDDIELMNLEEIGMTKDLLAQNPGLLVSAQMLMGFIAARPVVETENPEQNTVVEAETQELETSPDRGRMLEREQFHGQTSRASSSSSNGTSVFKSNSRQSSTGPPVPPKTPTTPSPFDTTRRQRSTPLSNAPTSWAKRPPPAHRRRSDASSHSRALSDSESSLSTGPSSFGAGRSHSRSSSRSSNPTSPRTVSPNTSFSPGGLESTPLPRPHSRTKSLGFHYGSPSSDHEPPPHFFSPGSDKDADNSYDHEIGDGNILHGISSLPMPRSSSPGSDSDSDEDEDEDEDPTMGLVLDRSKTSSAASLLPQDRLDALQRANAELGRKLMEAERTLQNKLGDHEVELEEMQARLEEVKSELSASKREEKELRSKERSNSTQITALESEIGKLQKTLDNARASYTSLQKQYQEQCAESERYRNTLRRRDQEIKDHLDAAQMHATETLKTNREQDAYEERIVFLENELELAQQAHSQLDEQKQENLMLKETIDRMRFDMDEMRSLAAGGVGSGASSAANSVSKSLGAELLGKMGEEWGMQEEVEEAEGDRSGETVVGEESDETESEDVVQTIITRTKRKVASRANKIETRTFEEVKEYSDASVQHDAPPVSTDSTSTQTDAQPSVLTASFSIQTDDVSIGTVSTQTDPEPRSAPRSTAEVNVQTEVEESSRPPSPTPSVEDTSMASSSSTVLPPTPKASTLTLPPMPVESPPAYKPTAQHVSEEILRKWHHGAQFPPTGITGGVSDDALEEWKALKEELGIDCSVIDDTLASSLRTNRPRMPKDGPTPRKPSRLYSIYNTYISPRDKDGTLLFPLGQVLLCAGASAVVFLAMTPYLASYYAVPGGPTYYDRAAWSSFNSIQAGGEGFAADGTAAFWNILGRVGGGAARIVQGRPT